MTVIGIMMTAYLANQSTMNTRVLNKIDTVITAQSQIQADIATINANQSATNKWVGSLDTRVHSLEEYEMQKQVTNNRSHR